MLETARQTKAGQTTTLTQPYKHNIDSMKSMYTSAQVPSSSDRVLSVAETYEACHDIAPAVVCALLMTRVESGAADQCAPRLPHSGSP
jgi:hypothetical protein